MKKEINSLHRQAEALKKKAWYYYQWAEKAGSQTQKQIWEQLSRSTCNDCRIIRRRIRAMIDLEDDRNNAGLDARLQEAID
jgi:uncharacterized protein HemY